MPAKTSALVAVTAAALAAHGVSAEELQANPIRKVVTMLQKMEKKVAAEGEKDEELFSKYMCYCKNAGNTLGASISGADNKIPQVESAIKEAEASKTQLESDLVAHRSDRAAAKDAMDKASSIRDKEATAYAKVKSDLETNIAALGKAITAVDNGMAGGFLQTNSATVVRNLMMNFDKIADYDRTEMLSFLAGQSSTGYAPSSGEISGILKQIKDEMSASLADATGSEKGSIKTFDELMAAKTKEVEALTQSIEDKSVRVGEVAVEITMMKNDLSDTQEALLEDKKFLADLDKNCETKKEEYEVVKKTRADELAALAETIKVLNDDDALELFKKTLPSASAASLLQSGSKSAAAATKALELIRSAPQGDRKRFEFIALALKGKTAGFEKVISMIDTMVGTLKKEQVDDDDKKEYCETQFDSLDDKKKGLEVAIDNADKGIADAEETISSTKAEIEALADAIKALDKSVTEATEQRQEEHAAYTDLMANNGAAKELIEFAKNRLQKFYNPALYVPPPERELTEEDRAMLAAGGTLAPTPAPGGIAGTGVTVLAEVRVHGADAVAPPPPPEAVKAYAKKSEESGGVISMMDLLIKDLTKEMTASEQEEKDAQADFETAMKDAAQQRAADTKSLADKESAKAESEAMLISHKDALKSGKGELMATVEVIGQLHGECDWLLQYYSVRKEARDGEITALGKAKDVLKGADYSL